MTAHATFNGSISSLGGRTVTERGFDYGKTSGVLDHSWTEVGTFGLGAFNHVITGLDLGSTYYVRTKAKNIVGWGYSAEASFATPAAVTYSFITNLTRMIMSPIGEMDVTRGGIVISARKPRKASRIEIQPHIKVGT
jgi:hypothetical protein